MVFSRWRRTMPFVIVLIGATVLVARRKGRRSVARSFPVDLAECFVSECNAAGVPLSLYAG